LTRYSVAWLIKNYMGGEIDGAEIAAPKSPVPLNCETLNY